ncbi:MAG TPA: hypothetical protein VGG33_17435, partial [Polyangia bacterium]
MNRPLLNRFAPMVALALSGCMSSTPPANPSGSGGNRPSASGGSGGGSSSSSGGSGGGTASGTGGSSGGSGGSAPASGGTSGGQGGGGGGSAAGGSSGGDAGSDTPMNPGAPACPGTTVMNGTLPITVMAKDVGARRVVTGVPEMFRIDRNPMTGDIVVMTRGGDNAFYKLDP